MRRSHWPIVLSVACLTSVPWNLHAGTPPGTAFRYQGQLNQSGVPVNSSADFSFQLFDQEVGGSQVGSTVEKANVSVENGLFTVDLDFGQEAFGTQALWLEVAARVPHDPDDNEPFVPLDPRQPVTPAPMALQTRGIFVGGSGNVGIGTAAPSKQLSVGGGVVIDQDGLQDGTMPDRMLTFGAPNSQEAIASKRTPGGNQFGLDFYTDFVGGGPQMSITHGGNVGIGTPTPIAPLHVIEPVLASGQAIIVQGESDGVNPNVRLVEDGGDWANVRMNESNGNAVEWQAGGSTRLTIQQDGNVGIGTTSPATPLAIRGPTGLTDVGITQNNLGGQNTMELTTADEDGNQRTRLLLRGAASDGVEFFRGNAGSETLTVSIDDEGDLAVHEGGVGIGTASPATPLALQAPTGTAPVGITQNNMGDEFSMELTTADVDGDQRTRVVLGGHTGDEISFFRGSAGEEVRSAMFDGTGNFRLLADDGSEAIAMGDLRIATGAAMAFRDRSGTAQVGLGVDNGQGFLVADTKNFRVPNPDEPGTDIVYACIEGPEAAAYVRGTAKLVDGEAIVTLPDHFRAVAVEEGMTVQLTPRSAESLGLAVTRAGLDGVVVQELRGGDGTYAFDWEVTAVRKGHEDYEVIRSSVEGH